MVETFNNNLEIKIDKHYSLNNYVHKVYIKPNTLLAKILNKKEIIVNSRHNYCILKPNFKINALSNDKIIEGIEDNTKTFFLGVQWHPESLNDNNSFKIFKYFVSCI